MTELEGLMYTILGEISKLEKPIVFKGALITKLILSENHYTFLERPTVDIDANWVAEPPPMNDLAEIVNQSLKSFDGKLYAEAIRDYGEKKSAGIAIKETSTGNIIVSMDISIKPVTGSRIYYYDEVGIKGVLANEILADKISVISSRMVFRRAKDVVDVYALAHCVKVRTEDIFDIYRKNPAREVGTLDEFYNRKQEIEHAYERLKGIEGKPDFADVYSYLTEFIKPFAEHDKTPKLWNSDKMIWKTETP
jgi:hypothetical protein